jgi:murein DD-endopeptidase MepM/ murein hydrolase activator NlpD
MRFTIKQYNSKIHKNISEKKFFIKKRFNRFWDTFLEKGHEKMTIMLIPHNEKNIFNFHISKFTILFFIALFMIVIVTSSYAIIKNASINSTKEELLANYKDIRSNLIRFELMTKKTTRAVDKLKPYIEDVYEITKGDNDVDKIWGSKEELNSQEDLKDYKYILPDEIFTLRELQKELVCATKTINTVKKFIDIRSKVNNESPLSFTPINPNKGHITSLFGPRRSPFGFGRDFHSGIDIAASQGTEIRATAPGTVMSAGWESGYGFLIRLQHKYGFQTLYGHCEKLLVRQGDLVKKGQIIGFVGQSGQATGYHCHYEIRLGNSSINPYQYMSRVW